MIALLGAVPEEIIDLRKQMALEETVSRQDYRIYRGKYAGRDVVLVQTGLGKEMAERATRFVLERYPVSGVISLGFAGALTGEARVSDIVLCATLYYSNGQTVGQHSPCHSDASLLARAEQALKGTTVRFRRVDSVTTGNLVSKPEAKRALGRSSRAEVVDMESYWIARIASARDVPFLAVRAISDTLQDCLPPFDRILDSGGRWRWQRALPYFVRHPGDMVKLVTIYRNSRRARQSLTTGVGHVIAAMPGGGDG